ncbi:hypothetical protein HELA111659_05410 [Helicobacter labetoulli]
MAQTPNKVKKKLNFYAKLTPKVPNDTNYTYLTHSNTLDTQDYFNVESALLKVVVYTTTSFTTLKITKE